MENVLNVPIQDAIEPALRDLFVARHCLLWVDCPSAGRLFSPTHNLSADYRSSIVGFVRNTRSLLQIENQSQCPPGFVIDAKLAEPGAIQLVFPLTARGVVKAVVQIVRSVFFGAAEIDGAIFVMRKFDLYGESLFKYDPFRRIALDFFTRWNQSQQPLSVIAEFFKCEIVEVWKLDVPNNQCFVYDRVVQMLVPTQSIDLGIVGYVLEECKTVNEVVPSQSSHFSGVFDGTVSGPVLAVPYEKNKKEIWCAVLRGSPRRFNICDEMEILALMPFVVRVVSDGVAETAGDASRTIVTLLGASRRILHFLDSDELAAVIESEAKKLVDCEFSRLALVDKQELLVKRQRFPKGTGICGTAIAEKKLMSIPDPIHHERYFETVDSADGLDPAMLIAAPILAPNQTPLACLLLVNKASGERFSESEERMICQFCVFAGIAIQNSVKYSANVQLVQQVFGNAGLQKILESCLTLNKLDRVSFYVNHAKSFYVSVGAEFNWGVMFAAECAENGVQLILSSDGIQSRFEDTKQRRKMVITVVDPGSLFSATGKSHQQVLEETICCIPIRRDDGAIVGVLEFSFFGKCSVADLRTFSATFSKCLFQSNLPEFSETFEIRDWLTAEERISREIPAKLNLSEDRSRIAFRFQFNVAEWDGIGLYQLVFKVMKKFELMEKFDFSNSRLFCFLNDLRASYRQIPIVNWRHAVDVFQFTAVLVASGRFDRILTRLDLFGVFVAALCHDCNHDGFERCRSARCENQHGQLFQKQSVIETEACMQAIELLSKEDNDIFTGLSALQQKQIWGTVCDCILATDLARHETILENFARLIDSGDFNPEEETEHRLLLMQMIMKAADFGAVARPYEVARDRTTGLVEEFFYQGTVSGSAGFCFTAEGSRREDIDKKASVLGILERNVKPVFEALGRFTAQLGYIVDQVTTNLMRFEREKAF
jgi:hypothetical protein